MAHALPGIAWGLIAHAFVVIMDIVMFQIRTNPTLQRELGSEIRLAGWQWIQGEINQLKGFVNIQFDVVGNKGIVHSSCPVPP
jgi:hypothetical protein